MLRYKRKRESSILLKLKQAKNADEIIIKNRHKEENEIRRKEMQDKETETIGEAYNYLLEQGLSLLSTDELSMHLEIIEGATPNWTTSRLTPKVEDLILRVWPLKLWEKVTEEVNNYLCKIPNLGKKYSKRHQSKYYQLSTIMTVVALHWEIETYGNSSGYNLKKAWKEIKKKIPISFDTFVFINAHFGTENVEELMDEFNEVSMGLIHPSTVLSLDEATYSYKPSWSVKKAAEAGGTAIPHKYVSRKPHPNCLWNDCVVTKMDLSEKPYVMIQVPFFKQPEKTPLEVVTKVTDSLENHYETYKFCLTLDALYDSEEVHQYLNTLESFFFCCGLNKCRHEEIYQVLSSGIKWNNWKGLHKDRVYSMRCMKDAENKKDLQLAVSNFHYQKTVCILRLNN